MKQPEKKAKHKWILVMDIYTCKGCGIVMSQDERDRECNKLKVIPIYKYGCIKCQEYHHDNEWIYQVHINHQSKHGIGKGYE